MPPAKGQQTRLFEMTASDEGREVDVPDLVASEEDDFSTLFEFERRPDDRLYADSLRLVDEFDTAGERKRIDERCRGSVDTGGVASDLLGEEDAAPERIARKRMKRSKGDGLTRTNDLGDSILIAAGACDLFVTKLAWSKGNLFGVVLLIGS